MIIFTTHDLEIVGYFKYDERNENSFNNIIHELELTLNISLEILSLENTCL